jgi:hypothetical protein
LPGTIAKGDEVDDKFDGVSAGLDIVEGEINDAIRLTNADITTAQVIADAASARAGKVVGFDSSGALALVSAGATWKGAWTPSTYYRQNDIVKDSTGTISKNSLFICLTTHTSQSALNLDSAKWSLMVDVEQVEESEAAAEAAQLAAEAAQLAAETAATNAASAYDSFDDRYLGAKASNPTTDNDGNALVTGALYWNTASNEMRVYSGSAWVTAYLPTGDYLTLTGGEMSGDIDLGNNDIVGVKTVAFEGEYDNGNSGSFKTVSFSNGQKQKITLTASTTLTLSFSGCGPGMYQLKVVQNGTGGYAITWIGIDTDDWIGKSLAPGINGSANGVSIATFWYDGTNVYGSIARVGMA